MSASWVPLHAGVPRGQQIHRKGVAAGCVAILRNDHNNEAVEEPWDRKTPNCLETFPKFYLWQFLHV